MWAIYDAFRCFSLSTRCPWICPASALVLVLGRRFISVSMPHRHISVLADCRGRFVFSYFTIANVSPSRNAVGAPSEGEQRRSFRFFTARLTTASPSLPLSLAPFSAAASQICTVNHFPSERRRSFALLKQ